MSSVPRARLLAETIFNYIKIRPEARHTTLRLHYTFTTNCVQQNGKRLYRDYQKVKPKIHRLREKKMKGHKVWNAAKCLNTADLFCSSATNKLFGMQAEYSEIRAIATPCSTNSYSD